jgi:hypothetical protein
MPLAMTETSPRRLDVLQRSPPRRPMRQILLLASASWEDACENFATG